MGAADTDILILLPLVYIIPTYILYIVELFTMFVNRSEMKFAGSFFNIWVSSAVNNLVCSILYFLTFRGAKAPALVGFYSIFPESGGFVTLILFVVYCTGAAQVVLDLILCFNRFTVVWLEARHVAFWKRYCKIFLFLAFLYPILTSWEAWFFDVRVLPVNASDLTQGYNWVPINPGAIPWMPIPLIVSGTVVITSTLSFLMNCYVCWYLLKQKKNKNGKKAVSKHDTRLFLYNLLIFFTQLVQLYLQMTFMFCSKEYFIYWFAVKIQFFVMDVNSLAPAWFILFMSSTLRTSIAEVFGNGKTPLSIITVHSINPNLHRRFKDLATG